MTTATKIGLVKALAFRLFVGFGSILLVYAVWNARVEQRQAVAEREWEREIHDRFSKIAP